MAPLGRASSWFWQPIVGTYICICGVRALTSSPESLANAAYGLPAVGFVLRSTGAVSLLAAAQAVAPTFFSTSARRAFWSAVTAGVEAAAVGVGVALGAADGVALGLGAFMTSPPPWPPVEELLETAG